MKILSPILVVVLVLSGCGAPRSPQRPAAPGAAQPEPPAQVPVVQEKPATPTEAVPPEAGYETPPTVILNNSGEKPVEILIGKATLTDTKLTYSQADAFMRLTGKAIVKNDRAEVVAKKEFAVTGTKNPGENIYTLRVDEIADASPVVVKAVAACTGVNAQNQTDCSLVIIDVFIKHENRTHTFQLQSRFNLTPPPPPTPAPSPAPVPAPSEPDQAPAPAPSPAPPPPAEEAPAPAPEPPPAASTPEPEDPEELQAEEEDESLDGRFEGVAQQVNIEELFTPPPMPETAPSPSPAPPPPAADRVTVNPEISQTRTGEIRPVNQAFGYPNDGKLRNATSLLIRQQTLKDKAPFEVVAPGRNRHFATYDLSEIIIRAGKELEKIYNKKLYLSSASAKNGGPLRPHKSHQMGVDADIGYPATRASANPKFPLVVRMTPREFHTQNYSTEATYKLFRFLFKQPDIRVDRIFADQAIIDELCGYAKRQNAFAGNDKTEVRQMFQNLQHVKGHGDHFHLRIKCSKSDPGCRSRIYRKMNTCG